MHALILRMKQKIPATYILPVQGSPIQYPPDGARVRVWRRARIRIWVMVRDLYVQRNIQGDFVLRGLPMGYRPCGFSLVESLLEPYGRCVNDVT